MALPLSRKPADARERQFANTNGAFHLSTELCPSIVYTPENKPRPPRQIAPSGVD